MRSWQGFQSTADRVADKSQTPAMRQAIAITGIVEEAAEVLGYVRKVVGHGHPFERDRLIEEVGDLLWQVAETATAYGIRLERMTAGVAFGARAVLIDGGLMIDAWQVQTVEGSPTDGGLAGPTRIVNLAGALSYRLCDQLDGGDALTAADVEDYLIRILRRLAIVARDHGITLSEAAVANEAKMVERYPDGFSVEASIRRSDTPAAKLARSRAYLHDWLANLMTRPVAIAPPPEVADLLDEIASQLDFAFR